MSFRRARRHPAFLAVISLAFAASRALAQTPPPPQPPAPAQPPAQPPVAPAPAQPPAQPPAAPPAVGEQPPAAPPTPAPEASTPPPAAVAPAPVAAAPAAQLETPKPYGDEALPDADEGEDEAWYDAFDVRFFGDAYASLNYNFPVPQSGTNGKSHYLDTSNGFALSWVGLDVSRVADPIGGTLSLRFGPSAKTYGSDCVAGGDHCDSSHSLENVKQAFGSWKPFGADGVLTLDFGKFDTIYGVEVADSQDNLNYTRGVLFGLGQPHFHTGLRASVELGEYFTVRALAVNGWNNTIDNNAGKTFGLQVTGRVPGADERELLGVSLGYLGGPERDDLLQCPAGQQVDTTQLSGCSPSTSATAQTNLSLSGMNSKNLRHLIDVVLTSDPIEHLHLVLNGDFGSERVRKAALGPSDYKQWFGAMLAARYGFGDDFGVAARGEYFHDDDGLLTYANNTVTIVTGTLTFDYRPGKNLILRLDNRLDWSDREIFQKKARTLVGTLPTSTLGVVVTTN